MAYPHQLEQRTLGDYVDIIRARMVHGLTKQQYDQEWLLAAESYTGGQPLQHSFIDPRLSSPRSTAIVPAPQYIPTPLINSSEAPCAFAGPGPLNDQNSEGVSGPAAHGQRWLPSTQSSFAVPFPQPSILPAPLGSVESQEQCGAETRQEQVHDPAQTAQFLDVPAQRQTPTTHRAVQHNSHGNDQEYCLCPLCKRLHPRRNLARDVRAHYSVWICPDCESSYSRQDLFARHHKRDHGCDDDDCYQIPSARVIDDRWKNMIAQQSRVGQMPDMDVKHAQGPIDAAQMDETHQLFAQLVSQCDADNNPLAVLERKLREPRYDGIWRQVQKDWNQPLHGVNPLGSISQDQAQTILDLLQNAMSPVDVLNQLQWTCRHDGQASQRVPGRKRRRGRGSRSLGYSPATTSALLSPNSHMETSPSSLQVPPNNIPAPPRSMPSHVAHEAHRPMHSSGASSEGQGGVHSASREQTSTAPSVDDMFRALSTTDPFAFAGMSPSFLSANPPQPPLREKSRFYQDPTFDIEPCYPPDE